MSRPYGKRTLPMGAGQGPNGAPQASEIQVNIRERQTIEQIALEVQRALAIVQDYGAIGLEQFRFRLLPLDAQGAPMVLRDELGQPVLTINIPEEPVQPVYRENEPGVGVTTTTHTSSLKAGRSASR